MHDCIWWRGGMRTLHFNQRNSSCPFTYIYPLFIIYVFKYLHFWRLGLEVLLIAPKSWPRAGECILLHYIIKTVPPAAITSHSSLSLSPSHMHTGCLSLPPLSLSHQRPNFSFSSAEVGSDFLSLCSFLFQNTPEKLSPRVSHWAASPSVLRHWLFKKLIQVLCGY